MKVRWNQPKVRYEILAALLGCTLTVAAIVVADTMPRNVPADNHSIAELRQAILDTEAELKLLPQRLIRETGGTLGHRTDRNELGNNIPWLEVDLGKTSTFDLIALIPMVNINENQQLSDFGFPPRFQITLFDSLEDQTGRMLFDSINHPDATHPNQAPILIDCPQATARRVRITALETAMDPNENTPVFALAELMVFDDNRNLAIGKPVDANYPVAFRPIYDPSYATDGYMPFSHPRTTKKVKTNYCLIWQNNPDEQISVTLDLTESFPIDEIRLYPVHLGNNFSIFHRTGLGFPRQFSIDISSDADFTNYETIFSTGDSDYPPPGHRLSTFPADGLSGRYVRITAQALPPDPYRGTPVLAFSEIEVISKGLPVSLNAEVTINPPDAIEFKARALRLVDGLSSHGEIPLLRVWLVQLSERNRLELHLAKLKIELARQTVWQAKLLRRLTWVIGLGIPLFGLVVIWQRLIRLRHLNRLRESLAADLHDEIGGNFSGIALLCDQLTSVDDMPPIYIRQLETIAKTSRESAHNTRSLVTFLESHNIQGELIANMEATASLLLTHLPYEFDITGSKYIQKLTPKEKWHLLLFFKEALNNIIKHAGATHATLLLHLTPRRLNLSISDNGHGIKGSTGAVRLPTHLKIRAQKLHGNAIISSSESGTTVTLTKKNMNKQKNKSIKVMVIEDNLVFLEALVDSLDQDTDFISIGNASCYEEAQELIQEENLQPDVILLDLEMPGTHGLDALPKLLEQVPGCHIIILTQSDREVHILKAITRGASGYLLKTAPLKEIFNSIREVHSGGATLDPKLAHITLQLIKRVQPTVPEEDDKLLTLRELEVLQMLSEGLVKKEIADKFDVSIHAIDKRMRRIYNKLQVQNVASAVAIAIRNGWI